MSDLNNQLVHAIMQSISAMSYASGFLAKAGEEEIAHELATARDLLLSTWVAMMATGTSE